MKPSTFKKQNLKFVLQIFNNFTFAALVLLGKELPSPHYETTSAFIKIISTWWQIVNVKTPSKGMRFMKYRLELRKVENLKNFWNILDNGFKIGTQEVTILEN